MPSDYRLKYINSLIGETNNLISVNNTPDEYVYHDQNSLISQNNINTEEGFEGGIHISNARAIFIIFAAIILILYVLEYMPQ